MWMPTSRPNLFLPIPKYSEEPCYASIQIRPGVRIAFVQAPDNVRIELLERI